MKKNTLARLLCLTSLAVAIIFPSIAGSAVAEDLTIVSEITGGKGGPVTATQYISAEKIRTSDGRFDTIMDMSSGRLINIDNKKKTYEETTLEELHEHFAELERMLDENPMMASMLGGATTVDVEKGSGSKEVAGYDCDQYFLSIGQKFKFEMWAARDLKAPTNYYDAKKMVYAAMGPMADRFNKLYDEMKEIDGVPLLTKMDTRVIGMKINSVSTATEVRKGPISADVFEPPAGYKKKKSPIGKKKR